MLNFGLNLYLEWGLLENFGLTINYSIFIDWMSLFFLSYVLLISGRVIYYSKEYIRIEIGIYFLILVLLFILSIILLIISPNIIRLLFGWDGLGAVSYLLIIYYSNNRSYNAGILTILINRFGDVLLLIRISFFVKRFCWDLIFLDSIFIPIYSYNIIYFLLITAGFTKRAQIPFSSWLPAAIAAPTPVSALVHSSTLVTAGVYLIIRYFYLIKDRFLIKYIVFISLITIVIAGVCANYEKDLKKIIALSTLRQLGVILFIVGIGNVLMGYYHILMHAIFKALLFLCAGGFIHSIINYQDVRLMGGVGKNIYFFSLGFRGCRLALIGFPFLAGYYSKDLICEYLIIGKINFFFIFLFLLRIGLTRSYRLKALNSVWGNTRIPSLGLIHERKLMITRIILLLIGSFMNGAIIRWFIIPEEEIILMPFSIKIIRVIFILLGVLVGIFIRIKFLGLWRVRKIWFLRRLSSRELGYSVLFRGKMYYKSGDFGWNEYYRKLGINFLFNNIFFVIKYENFMLRLYTGGIIFWVLYFIFR